MEDQQVPEGFVPDVKPDGFVPDTVKPGRANRRRSVIITRPSGLNPGPSTTDDTPPEPRKPGFVSWLTEPYNSGAMKDSLEHVAQPNSLGDMLGLAIPSGMGSVIRGLMGYGNVVKEGAMEAPRLRDIPASVGRVIDRNNPTFSELPITRQMDRLPMTPAVERGKPNMPPPAAQQSIKDLPLWKQQQMMEQTGSADVPLAGGRVQTPPHVPTAPVQDVSSLPKPPIGKAPTVEDSITQALQEIMQAKEKPTIMSGAPPVETAGGGPFKQSGKFGKSGNLGQAGGYSSGMPPPQTAPVVSTPTPGPGGSPQGPPPDVAPPTSSPLSEMRGTAEPTLPGDADVIKPPTLDSAVADIFKPSNSRMDELLQKFGGKSNDAETARALRTKFGSREAARKMFGSSTEENIAKIKQLAPGDSEIPTDAVDRMRQSMERGYDWGGKDDIIKGD